MLNPQPLSKADLKSRIVRFARGASMEVTPMDEELLPALVNKLPAGMTLYVAHTPKASLDDVVRVALKVESLGFRASPHIVARRLESERALRDALRELHDGGVEQVLYVAGDREVPVKFTNTLEVLDTGASVDAGIMKIGVAGYPEGNRVIGPSALWDALRQKQVFAERTGTRMHIVTQFGFNPEAILAWDKLLAENGIKLPVYVGIAGPTPLPRLIKFAMQCGIGASLNSVVKNMSAMSNLARLATSPDQMLIGLIRGGVQESARIVAPHLFAFGGTMATARWLRAVMDGTFELQGGGDKFIVDA